VCAALFSIHKEMQPLFDPTKFTTEARRHGGTEARRHGGTEARRHGGTEARRFLGNTNAPNLLGEVVMGKISCDGCKLAATFEVFGGGMKGSIRCEAVWLAEESPFE
jgi:hypothetical protein